jgi:prepilin-type N-terminal cleavage/methylation domain-containing protein
MRIARWRAGFTLIEVTIALVLIGLVLANVGMVMRSSSAAFELRNSLSNLDLQADTTLDRIALAVMGSSPDTLIPSQSAPLWSSQIEYQKNLGMEDGKPVWSAPERIEETAQKEQVVWTQNPDGAGARSVVWTNWVRSLLEGELANGIDDNGNGLVDESGLSFAFQGKTVDIRLSLQREGPDHRTLTRTVQTRVTCRN